MNRRILDISDCSESPLLSSSRSRYRQYKRAALDSYRPVHRPGTRSRNNRLAGLTEAYFTGVNPGSSLDYQLASPSLQATSAEPANVSYQARCAERWWAEFRRWFGTLN